MQTAKLKARENQANEIIKKMKLRGMEAFYVNSKEEALKKVLALIPEHSSVANGGSMTLDEIGILDAVKAGNYHYIDRMAPKTEEETKKMKAEMINADYFLMSSNAVTLDGMLVNIDGRGNRVSYLCYGPENIILVVGMNKITKDIETGIDRVRNFASPPNAIRLKRNTPCAKFGRCGDCLQDDCICCQLVVTRKSMIKNRIKVVFVGEDLGY